MYRTIVARPAAVPPPPPRAVPRQSVVVVCCGAAAASTSAPMIRSKQIAMEAEREALYAPPGTVPQSPFTAAADTAGLRVAALSRADMARKAPTDWRTLAASPINGFVLREGGLYDAEMGQLVTADGVRKLINGLSKIEGKGHQEADSRQAPHMISEWEAGINRNAPYAFCVAGLWVILTVLPKTYDSATPRNSVLVRYYYRHRLEPQRLERLCMRHRTLFNATNARPMVSVGMIAAFAVSTAWLVWDRRYGDANPQKDYTRDSVHYYQHVECSLKWLFAVYYHHPAYTGASARPQKMVLMNAKDARE
jgi:hypothetical protein